MNFMYILCKDKNGWWKVIIGGGCLFYCTLQVAENRACFLNILRFFNKCILKIMLHLYSHRSECIPVYSSKDIKCK